MPLFSKTYHGQICPLYKAAFSTFSCLGWSLWLILCVDAFQACCIALKEYALCVWTIWKDVKLLTMQGDGEDIWGSIQRSSSYDPRISPGTPGDVPATPFQFLVHGNRLSQVPACRLVSIFLNGFCCIWTFLRALFPTVFNPLYGFRNLIYCWLRQMEQLHLART